MRRVVFWLILSVAVFLLFALVFGDECPKEHRGVRYYGMNGTQECYIFAPIFMEPFKGTTKSCDGAINFLQQHCPLNWNIYTLSTLKREDFKDQVLNVRRAEYPNDTDYASGYCSEVIRTTYVGLYTKNNTFKYIKAWNILKSASHVICQVSKRYIQYFPPKFPIDVSKLPKRDTNESDLSIPGEWTTDTNDIDPGSDDHCLKLSREVKLYSYPGTDECYLFAPLIMEQEGDNVTLCDQVFTNIENNCPPNWSPDSLVALKYADFHEKVLKRRRKDFPGDRAYATGFCAKFEDKGILAAEFFLENGTVDYATTPSDLPKYASHVICQQYGKYIPYFPAIMPTKPPPIKVINPETKVTKMLIKSTRPLTTSSRTTTTTTTLTTTTTFDDPCLKYSNEVKLYGYPDIDDCYFFAPLIMEPGGDNVTTCDQVLKNLEKNCPPNWSPDILIAVKYADFHEKVLNRRRTDSPGDRAYATGFCIKLEESDILVAEFFWENGTLDYVLRPSDLPKYASHVICQQYGDYIPYFPAIMPTKPSSLTFKRPELVTEKRSSLSDFPLKQL